MMMKSKTRDFSALQADLEAVNGPTAAEDAKRGRGRPPVETEQFTLRITHDLRKKLATLAAEEMAATGRNVTPQMIAVRLLEEKLNG
jgi:hypothetical protein